MCCESGHTIFLSTPSARRATGFIKFLHGIESISIHALREEGDYLLDLLSRMTNEFLSTPSARRATRTGGKRPVNMQFLSTPSARRATQSARSFLKTDSISIHALREEGDVRLMDYCFYELKKFLSTPSARRATLHGLHQHRR